MCTDLYIAYSQPDIPQLYLLSQAYGEEYAAETFIASHLIKINEFVGTKSKLTDQQLIDLSYQILAEYGYLNLFEFIVFCGRLRSGRYEDFYGSIDPMRIMKSLEEFCRDRWSDIDKAEKELKKEQRKLESVERIANAVTFGVWYNELSEEEKQKVLSTPYGANSVRFMHELQKMNENEKQ